MDRVSFGMVSAGVMAQATSWSWTMTAYSFAGMVFLVVITIVKLQPLAKKVSKKYKCKGISDEDHLLLVETNGHRIEHYNALQ